MGTSHLRMSFKANMGDGLLGSFHFPNGGVVAHGLEPCFRGKTCDLWLQNRLHCWNGAGLSSSEVRGARVP